LEVIQSIILTNVRVVNLSIHKFIITLLFAVFSLNFSYADNLSQIKFIENMGQWDMDVLFKADIPGGHIFVSKNCLTYYLIDKKAVHDHQHGMLQTKGNAQVVKVYFEGAVLKNFSVEANQPYTEYYNFFIGAKQNWKSKVKAYKQIVLKNIYPGIDFELNSDENALKSNFIVHPFANPQLVKLKYEGADSIFLKNGDLNLNTWVGTITEKRPVSFQRLKKLVTNIFSEYKLSKNTVSFTLGEYQKDKTLIIDPTLIFGTYVGSVSDNFGFCSAFDKNGNAFAGGSIYGANFPRTTGRFQANFAGGNGSGNEYARDCIIAKFSADGTNMLWASYLGGSNNEQPHSMTSDSSGGVIIMGSTYSSNFPTSASGYDVTFNGMTDIFVSKLSSDGASLVGSTFLGGTKRDGIMGNEQLGYPSNGILCYNYADCYRGEVIIDRFNNIYISSVTSSSNSDLFPLPNAFQPSYGGGASDGVIAKFNNSLTSLNFCTYYGGSGDDASYALIIDILNNLYVTGGTTSANLPFIGTGFGYKGGVDGYIIKTNTSGSGTPNAIYVGTSVYDQTYLIQVNDRGDVYVIGQTTGSINVTPGVYNVPNAKHFIKGFNRNLSSEIISTTFGKTATFPSLSPTAFVIDKCDRLYFSGWGGSVNSINNQNVDNTNGLPTTANAFQRSTDGSDFYLMILGDGLKELTYASFYGGALSAEHVDGGTSHFDQNFTIYQTVCAGCWGNNDFPTTPGAWSNSNPGRNNKFPGSAGCNIGVFKFNLDASIYPPQFRDTILYVTAGDSLNFLVNVIDKDGDSILVTATSQIFNPGLNPASFDIISRSKGLTQARLSWQTLCKDILIDTFEVDLFLTDNACPLSKNGVGKIKIVVKSPPIQAPFPQCLSSITDQQVAIKWSAYATKPTAFGYLKLLKSVNNAPFQAVDSTYDWTKSEIIDKQAFNHKTIQTKYALLGINSCGIVGDTSRVSNSVFEGDTITDPGFVNVADSVATIYVTDTLNLQFYLADTDNKDSNFVSLSGSFLSLKNLKLDTLNGVGFVKVSAQLITNCNTAIGTYVLYIKVRDNQCPQPREKTKTITVNILPISNLPLPTLSCPVKINNDVVKINLPSFSTTKYFKKYKLIKYNANNFASELGQFSLNAIDTFFVDNMATNNPNVNYCYQTISVDICDNLIDSSNKVCLRSQKEIYPDKLTWHTVTVNNDIEVKLIWNKSANKSDQFSGYNIYKMKDRNGSSFSYLTTVNSINDTIYTDKNVLVDEHSYCYKVTNSNECGLESIQNDSACSILLKGVSEKVKHTLAWQDYNYWVMGAQKYELLRADAYNTNFVNILPNSSKLLVTQDINLDYQVGLYYYQVVAYQNPNLGNAKSESNMVTLIQAPYVYVPNAYTANGDNLNDVWKAEHAFVKEFDLKIYNRWGQLLFETTDKNKPFSLNLNTQIIANDVYVYLINYSGWNGESKTLKGNFTVLK
jgi:gliding motility-associated-like protein